MLDTLRNAWKIEDLRKKLLFTFFILMLTRIGSQIPVPFLDPGALTSMVSSTGGIFSYLDMLTGGAFSRSTLFALSISPYITASIVIQLLTVAIPYLENLAKEGEEALYRKTLAECGGNEEAARRLFAYQRQERERASSEEAAAGEAFRELCDAFPGRFREPGELPAEVVELAARRGLSLLDAYLRYEHEGLEKAAREKARQEKAALASSGSMTGESAQPDPDAEAFSAAFSAALH